MKKALSILFFVIINYSFGQINYEESTFQAITFWDLKEKQNYDITISQYRIVKNDSILKNKIKAFEMNYLRELHWQDQISINASTLENPKQFTVIKNGKNHQNVNENNRNNLIPPNNFAGTAIQIIFVDMSSCKTIWRI